MASPRRSVRDQSEERSKREERANRILDAAAELMLRWGYNKTTIDDIARHAGVAKGTIYLHWKTREDLFTALMKREYIRLSEDIKERVAGDPAGGTLRGITKHTMLATMKSPLMKAIFLRDTDLLGEWLRKEQESPTFSQQIDQAFTLFELFRAREVVRNDIDIRKQLFMQDAITLGFLIIDQYMPSEFQFSDEEIAEMAAETAERTFAPSLSISSPPDEQAKQETAQTITSYIDELITLRTGQDQEEVSS